MSDQEVSPRSAGVARVDRRLVALNAGLVGVLAMVTWTGAQPAGQASAASSPRSPGQYTMVAGRVLGGSSHAVYILDAVNHEMAALAWDRSRERFEPIGYRNFASDAVYLQPKR